MGERSPYICPSLKNVKHELSLVHKSQRREQRDLITRCDVRKGQPSSLICLQIHPPTSLSSRWSPAHPSPCELNNLNVGLHTHVIINKLCPPSLSSWTKQKQSQICHGNILHHKVTEVHQSKGSLPSGVMITFYGLKVIAEAYLFFMLVKFPKNIVSHELQDSCQERWSIKSHSGLLWVLPHVGVLHKTSDNIYSFLKTKHGFR